jgi:hypothetical protein
MDLDIERSPKIAEIAARYEVTLFLTRNDDGDDSAAWLATYNGAAEIAGVEARATHRSGSPALVLSVVEPKVLLDTINKALIVLQIANEERSAAREQGHALLVALDSWWYSESSQHLPEL